MRLGNFIINVLKGFLFVLLILAAKLRLQHLLQFENCFVVNISYTLAHFLPNPSLSFMRNQQPKVKGPFQMVLEHDNFSIVNTWSFYSGCLFGGDNTQDNRVTWRRVDNEKLNLPIFHSHKPTQYNWVLVWLLKWFFYWEGKITLCWHVPTKPSKPLHDWLRI